MAAQHDSEIAPNAGWRINQRWKEIQANVHRRDSFDHHGQQFWRVSLKMYEFDQQRFFDESLVNIVATQSSYFLYNAYRD